MTVKKDDEFQDIKYRHLVLQTNDFIVFIDCEIDIDWKTTDDYDNRKKEEYDAQRYHEVMNHAAEVECIANNHLEESKRINFKRMIGEAICRNFEFDYENAEKMLNKAENYISERNEEVSRKWYLKSCLCTTFLFCLFGSCFWLFRENLASIIGWALLMLLLTSVAGALGALLSVILRMGTSNLDAAAGRCLHYLEGSSKIFCGAISAVLVGLAMNAEIILPIFSKIGKTNAAMIFAGLIAGASERWAPSIISAVGGEKNLDKSTKKKSDAIETQRRNCEKESTNYS